MSIKPLAGVHFELARQFGTDHVCSPNRDLHPFAVADLFRVWRQSASRGQRHLVSEVGNGNVAAPLELPVAGFWRANSPQSGLGN